MIIPSKHTGHTRDGVRRVFDSGSSGPSETTQTVDVPDWAKGFAKEGVGAASSLVFNRDASGAITGFKPYESYTGERTAQFTPLQQQAFAQAGQQGIAGQIGQATGLAGQAAQGALGAGAGFSPYQTGQFGSQAASYMSPYMQNVVDYQKAGAIQDFERLRGGRNARAVQAGAFGGSRQGVQEGLAEEALTKQLGGIEATGRQSAYEQAASQFGADRAAQLAQAQAQAAEQGRVQTGTEASRQFGAGQGLAAIQASQAAGTQLVGLGEKEREAQIQNAQLLDTLGRSQQAETQAGLDIGYQDYLRQQGYPAEQLAMLSNTIQGLPVQNAGTTTQTGYGYTNPVQQAAGAGLAGLSLYKAYQ